MTRKSGSGMELTVGRNTGAVGMTSEEREQLLKVEQLEDASHGEHTAAEGEKLVDVVDFVNELGVTNDENKDREGKNETKKDMQTKIDQGYPYYPESKGFAPLEPHPQVHPALADKPQAYLGEIFANAHKASEKFATEDRENCRLRDLRIDCPNCRKRSCRRHQYRKNRFDWQPTCPSCHLYPCVEHNSPSQWQQNVFLLCPHILMQLFWKTDDLSNKHGEWGFAITPVLGDQVEHEKCKGSIKGIQYNVDRMGDMVRERMDHMGLRGPPNVGRVIRNMPSFLQMAELESDYELKKMAKDEGSWIKQKNEIEKKRNQSTIESGGLTAALLEGKDEESHSSGTETPAEEHIERVSPKKKSEKSETKGSSEKRTPAKKAASPKKTTVEQKSTSKGQSSASVNKKTTPKAESIHKETDKRKRPLSEEFIYDSDEGLSDVDQKEAEKVEEQEKTLVSDDEQPKKKAKTKDESSVINKKSNQSTRKADAKQPGETARIEPEPSIPEESSAQITEKVATEGVEEIGLSKRKVSEVDEESEVEVEQPPTKKRKASEINEVPELETREEKESSLIKRKASEADNVSGLEAAGVEENSPTKRKVSEAEDVSESEVNEVEENSPTTRKASDADEIPELEVEGNKENSPIKSKVSAVEEILEPETKEMEENSPIKRNASEVSEVREDEPQEAEEKTPSKRKTSEVEKVSEDRPREVEEQTATKRKALETEEVPQTDSQELEVEQGSQMDLQEIEEGEKQITNKRKASETDSVDEVEEQEPMNKKRKVSGERE